jgi:predicted amidohydrolase
MPFPERQTTVAVPRPPFLAAVAQVEPTLGNLKVNLKIHLDAIDAARKDGVDLLVFPELSLTGYYLRDQVPEVAEPRDGPLRRAIREAAGDKLAVVYGFVEESPSARFYNASCFIDGASGPTFVHRKVYLPTYGMFDEQRYFAAGGRIMAFDTRFGRLGLLICEDAWHLSAGVILQADGIDVLMIVANSPGRGVREEQLGSRRSWELVTRTYATFLNVPVIFANRVGFEDGVNFWGGSAIVGAGGSWLAQAPEFEVTRISAVLDPRDTRRERILTPTHRDECMHLTIEELDRIRHESYRSDTCC